MNTKEKIEISSLLLECLMKIKRQNRKIQESRKICMGRPVVWTVAFERAINPPLLLRSHQCLPLVSPCWCTKILWSTIQKGREEKVGWGIFNSCCLL